MKSEASYLGGGVFARSILALPCMLAEVNIRQLEGRPWVVRITVSCPCGFSAQVDGSFERFETDYVMDLPHQNGKQITAEMRAFHEVTPPTLATLAGWGWFDEAVL